MLGQKGGRPYLRRAFVSVYWVPVFTPIVIAISDGSRCAIGEPSKQCKLEEMSNICLHLIDARSAWNIGFFAFTLQCLGNQYTIGVSYRII